MLDLTQIRPCTDERGKVDAPFVPETQTPYPRDGVALAPKVEPTLKKTQTEYPKLWRLFLKSLHDGSLQEAKTMVVAMLMLMELCTEWLLPPTVCSVARRTLASWTSPVSPATAHQATHSTTGQPRLLALIHAPTHRPLR